jgi:hypothetical protein
MLICVGITAPSMPATDIDVSVISTSAETVIR